MVKLRRASVKYPSIGGRGTIKGFGVQVYGHCKKKEATRFEYTMHLRKRATIISNMLKHFCRRAQIKALGGKAQVLDIFDASPINRRTRRYAFDIFGPDHHVRTTPQKMKKSTPCR